VGVDVTTQHTPRPVFLDDPRSSAAEAYRILRNYLHHAMPRPRSVLVTSAEVGAGKSSVTANLGISLAQAECRVLLVDADLRRPVLHTLLQVPSALGLSSYLAGTAELETVVSRTAVPNLVAGDTSHLLPHDRSISDSLALAERLTAAMRDVITEAERA